jgi:dihydroneopterin aldolase
MPDPKPDVPKDSREVPDPRRQTPDARRQTDSIRITGIEVFGYHGVLAREKSEGQLFLVDVELWLDLSAAGESDDLSDTVNYGLLAQRVHEVVASERWDLIERVAARVAETVLEHARVQEVVATVHKPGAPIAVGFSDVSVTIRRGQG